MHSIARIYVEVDLKAAEHLAREHGCGATYVSIFGGSVNNMGCNACGEMSAALGLAQFGRIDELLAKLRRTVGLQTRRLPRDRIVGRYVAGPGVVQAAVELRPERWGRGPELSQPNFSLTISPSWY